VGSAFGLGPGAPGSMPSVFCPRWIQITTLIPILWGNSWTNHVNNYHWLSDAIDVKQDDLILPMHSNIDRFAKTYTGIELERVL